MAAPVRNVRDLLARRWGVSFTARESFVSVATSRTTVLNQNPTRVAVLLVNDGAFQVMRAPTPADGGPAGPRIDPAGGSLFLWWEEDGELVGQQFDALAVGGASLVRIYEVLIESPGPQATAGVP